MKRTLLGGFAALLLAGTLALAQTTTAPPGQDASGQINAGQFNNNTDSDGFGVTSINPAVVVPATATTQALAFVIRTKAIVVTTCSGTTGVRLPAVNRYEVITVMNRSGGSCLVFPSIGATVETALGTDGATNASFTQLTNTDVSYRPITPTRWLQ